MTTPPAPDLPASDQARPLVDATTRIPTVGTSAGSTAAVLLAGASPTELWS